MFRFDDSSLSVGCVPRSVSLTTEMIPDAARGPALLRLYRRVKPLLLAKAGPPELSSDKVNIDLWTVKWVAIITSFSHLVSVRISCLGKCGKTSVTLNVFTGIVCHL